jgi:outer membrane receptor protein involved in Fe transport
MNTFLVCSFALIVAAQSNGNIQGHVFENNTPVEFVNMLLFAQNDSLKLVKSNVTDSTGFFVLENVPIGNYFLKMQLIGYQLNTLKVSLTSRQLDMGKLPIQMDSKVLKSVEIAARKPIIQRTAQGFIVNAAATLSQEGGTATDLLRNTPTVAVDAEGSVTVRGKTPLILINGRNSNLSNTDQIPVNSIESIEIINNPSAKYDAEAEAGIINIKLKKSQRDGTNGAVSLGVGYGAKGRVNSSILLNHRSGNWNLGLAYDNRFSNRTRNVNANRLTFNDSMRYALTQNRFDNRTEGNQNLRLNLDYNINSKNILSLELIGGLPMENNDETLHSRTNTKSSLFFRDNVRRSQELRKEQVTEGAMIYKRQFENPQKSLSVSISTSSSTDREHTNIATQAFSDNNLRLGNPALQYSAYDLNANVTNIQLDYVQPVNAIGILETGYKSTLRFLDSDFKTQDQINDIFISNPNQSNIFQFREQIHAAYGRYKSYTGNKEKPTLRYDFGVRFEQTFNHGNSINNTNPFDNQYFKIFPSANIAYYLKPNEFIKASYSRRINRPRFGQLNPFTDVTDSLTQRSGNPHLQPELVHSLEVGYSKDWDKSSFSTTIFYRYINNFIQPFTKTVSNGVLFTQPFNLDDARTLGLETMWTASIYKNWDINVSCTFFQQHINGSNINAEIVKDVFSWNGKAISNFAIWKGGKLQFIGIYNAPMPTPQGERISTYNIDFGFQQKILHDKARLGLIITDIFNTQRNGSNWITNDFTYYRLGRVDSRAILLTFAYTFGTSFKEKLMENKFSNE